MRARSRFRLRWSWRLVSGACTRTTSALKWSCSASLLQTLFLGSPVNDIGKCLRLSKVFVLPATATLVLWSIQVLEVSGRMTRVAVPPRTNTFELCAAGCMTLTR